MDWLLKLPVTIIRTDAGSKVLRLAQAWELAGRLGSPDLMLARPNLACPCVGAIHCQKKAHV